MQEAKTFPKGGIHPPDLKSTSESEIVSLPPPQKIVLHVQQHIGAAANPVFGITDKVTLGQLIAEASSFVSSPIHASISGKIIGVGKFMHPTGVKTDAIAIERNLDEPEPEFHYENGFNLPIEEICNRVKNSGLVGLGGAGFPCHVKLFPPEGTKIHTVIVNGVECEPVLTADHRVMLETPDKVVDGLKIILKLLNASKGIIAIEKNKQNAIDLLNQKVQNEENISIQPLEVKYPQGGEKQLISACLGVEVPSGKLPMHVGVVVQNVASTAALADAINYKKPLIEKVVTLAGNCVKKPGNYRVRIGTTVAEFIEMAGGLKEDVELKKIIMGGPMMGYAISDLNVPIIKTTGGILCWDEQQAEIPPHFLCIRCGSCVESCPMGLDPQLLKKLIDSKLFKKAIEEGIMDCIECGCCSYSCPAAIDLVQTFRFAKTFINKNKIK